MGADLILLILVQSVRTMKKMVKNIGFSEKSTNYFNIIPKIVIFDKQNGHIFLIWAKNKKIRTLFLLQLLILKKKKCLYFFEICIISQVITNFLFLSFFMKKYGSAPKFYHFCMKKYSKNRKNMFLSCHK